MKAAAKEKIQPFDPSEGWNSKKVPIIQVARMVQRRLNPIIPNKNFEYKKHLNFAWVPADKVYINYERQRWPEPTQINNLRSKWNINCVTPLQCRYSVKEDRYYGSDGQQHTIEWLNQYGEQSEVPVFYVTSEDESIESLQVLALNNDNEPMAKYFIHQQEVKLQIPEAVALEECVLSSGCITAYKKKSPGSITHILDLWTARDHYGLENLSLILKKMRIYWPTEKIYTATMLGFLKLKSLLDEKKIYTDTLLDDIFYQCTKFFENSDRLHLDIKNEFEKKYPTNYKGMGVREKIASGIISAYEQLSGKTLCEKPFEITMPIIKQTI